MATQISRLLEAHEIMLKEIREAAHEAAEYGDDGTNDLLVSSLIRTHEMQVWFIGEHLAATPPSRQGPLRAVCLQCVLRDAPPRSSLVASRSNAAKLI